MGKPKMWEPEMQVSEMGKPKMWKPEVQAPKMGKPTAKPLQPWLALHLLQAGRGRLPGM